MLFRSPDFGQSVLVSQEPYVRAVFGQPVSVSHERFRQTEAVGLCFVTMLVNFAQLGLGVQKPARLVDVFDNAFAEVELLVAALAAFLADRFPLTRTHDRSSTPQRSPWGAGSGVPVGIVLDGTIQRDGLWRFSK